MEIKHYSNNDRSSLGKGDFPREFGKCFEMNESEKTPKFTDCGESVPSGRFR